jgi:hypothetical protein
MSTGWRSCCRVDSITPALHFITRRNVAVFAVLLLWVFNGALLASILGILGYTPLLVYTLIILGSLLYPVYIISKPVDKAPIDKIIYYITLISILILTSLLALNIYYVE